MGVATHSPAPGMREALEALIEQAVHVGIGQSIPGMDVSGSLQHLVTTAEALRSALSAPQPAPSVREDAAKKFNQADWYWRTMDPDDSGDSPEEAISRAMIGPFCVCEIASSFTGPTRFGFIAPVLDPERDDEEFVHFATQVEAIAEAKRRASLPTPPAGKE